MKERWHRSACFAALMISALASPGWGQEAAGEILPLNVAVEEALQGHPELAMGRAEQAAAAAAIDESRAAWYPSLSVSGSAIRHEEPMVATPLHGFTPGSLPVFDRTLMQGAGTLSFTLFDGPGRPARIKSARAEAQAGTARLAAGEQALAARTAVAYLEVLSQAELLAAHDARLAALRAELDRVDQRSNAGKAAQVEVLRLDATLAAAEAQRVHLAGALDLAERDLALLVGRPVEACRRARLVPMTLVHGEPPPDEAGGPLPEDIPAVNEAEQRIAAAAANAAAARGARWPLLKLAVNALAYDSPAIDPVSEWNAGLSLSMPLFTGGAQRARIAQADAALEVRRDRLALVRLQTQEEFERARRGVEEARAQVSSLRRAVAGFAEVVRIEKLALEVGTGTQTDYLDGEASLLAAQAGLIEAGNHEIAARIELARVSGRLDAGWIERELEESHD